MELHGTLQLENRVCLCAWNKSGTWRRFNMPDLCSLSDEAERERKRRYAGGMSAPLLSGFEHSTPRFSCQTLYSTLSSAKAEVLQRQNTDMRYMRRVDTHEKKVFKDKFVAPFFKTNCTVAKKKKINPKHHDRGRGRWAAALILLTHTAGN